MAGALPERTTLVLVGVEKYAVGPAWDLPGPAADARRFAEWFWSRGVPRERTIALISALPENAGVWADAPVPVREATRENVRAVLVNDAGHEAGGDLLVVLWGGHGQATPGNRVRRHLFTADATDHDPVNLFLDDVLAHRRSRAGARYRSQLWMVDACQTLTSPEWARRGLPVEDLGVRDERLGLAQEVLIAAVLGQPAENIDDEQTGVWSREVLDLLRDSETWPPDAADLAVRLHDRFTRMRLSGESRQTPFHLYFRSTAGREGSMLSPAPEPHSASPSAAKGGGVSDRELVELLVVVPGFLELTFRNQVIANLPTNIGGVLTRSDRARPEALSMVQTCRHYPGGLDLLANALLLVAGDGPAAEKAARALRNA